MTTLDIETAANSGDIASGDFNLKLVLRKAVVPQFLEDVGLVGWRRKTIAITVTAGTRTYSLPTDFESVHAIYWPPNFDNQMKFIGEDPRLVAMAESSTTPGTPGGYYIVTETDGSKTLKLDCVPAAGATLPLQYLSYVKWADLTTSVDMAKYVPEPFHWALVVGLRAQVMLDRFGQKDPRYSASVMEYQSWVARAMVRKEQGPRNYSRFVS